MIITGTMPAPSPATGVSQTPPRSRGKHDFAEGLTSNPD